MSGGWLARRRRGWQVMVAGGLGNTAALWKDLRDFKDESAGVRARIKILSCLGVWTVLRVIDARSGESELAEAVVAAPLAISAPTEVDGRDFPSWPRKKAARLARGGFLNEFSFGLEVRDDFDFDAGGLRQAGHLDGGAGGEIAGEIFGVDFVHAGEVREVGQEHGALHDVGEGELLVVEDGLHILQHAFGLHLDVALDEVAGRGVDGDLSGAEEQIADAHGMVIGTDRSR